MITISLCMIVKNEAAVLDRCLSSIADLMDEIIIVDTGSTDNTKEIAAHYTDKIYDYTWENDFSAARNFAFSKASMEYIYSADADEMLDETNHTRFLHLKAAMLPEIEIVQMHYCTKTMHNTTANFSDEYRPKLYRRLRTFTWVDAIHETVRLDPVVFDSDIEILHLPQSLHNKRDFSIFRETYLKNGFLSEKLHSMYAKELFISGTDEDFLQSQSIFEATLANENSHPTQYQEAVCILAHIARIQNQVDKLFSLSFKLMPDFLCSELCYEIGTYFMTQNDYTEAIQWFEIAYQQKQPIIDIRTGGQLAFQALSQCFQQLAESIDAEISNAKLLDTELSNSELSEKCQHYRSLAKDYEAKAQTWELPADEASN